MNSEVYISKKFDINEINKNPWKYLSVRHKKNASN